MRTEVIAIGDELTTGQRLDTNSQWLSQRLTEMGVQVAFHTTIGDELADNVAAFQTAIERADLIVLTGGLGPTADDLTRDALATATGAPLVRDEASLRFIEQLFASRGREMPARNQVQADFPEGSQPIRNPNGTAPGIEMLIARTGRTECALFALPGVPAEMHEMWQASVAPRIRQLQPEPRVTRHRRIKCFGVGESQLEAMLPDLIRRDREPRVGITASDATITLRITATEKDEQACQAAMQPTAATIYELLGNVVFGEEEDELEQTVLRLLEERAQTLAVAEWATEGLVNRWLQEASGASNFLKTGTTLTDRSRLLQLSGEIADHSPSTAIAMAEMIRTSAAADIGLAVAAFPPVIDAEDAYVHLAIALPDQTHKLRFRCAAHPALVKSRTAKQALNALRLKLMEM